MKRSFSIFFWSLLLTIFVTTGCTQSIGPYVRNVHIDRENNLVVERCVHFPIQATYGPICGPMLN
jgi:hypothetical protein